MSLFDTHVNYGNQWGYCEKCGNEKSNCHCYDRRDYGCDRCGKEQSNCNCYHRRDCGCDKCQSNKWSALSDDCHPMEDSKVVQNADQVNSTTQSTDELIAIKDSCDIDVRTTTTDAAVNIQAAIQLAIAVIVEISIADGDEQEDVKQDLMQLTKMRQCNSQRTVIENSRGVEITTTDTNLAISAQIAVQILVALLVALDIL